MKCPGCCTVPVERKQMMNGIRSQQEIVNKRFKDRGILFQRFHHDVRLHRDVFAAIAVLCQLTIQLGEPLFPVTYDDEVREGWGSL